MLDSIQIGDLIKCNDWKIPLKVMGVSDNYFVMSRPMCGKVQYSVCEKILCNHTRNNYTKGNYRIGRDDMIFGHEWGYEWTPNCESVIKYLESFEAKGTELSVRAAVNLKRISIKRLGHTN